MTGITARQLQLWDERGLVVSAARGTLSDLFLGRPDRSCDGLGAAAEGILERMRKVVQLLQETVPPALAQTVSGSPNYHLLTDGRALETSPHEVVDLVKNSRQPMFAICLSDTVREVKALVGGGKRPGRCRPEKARSMRKAKFG